MNSYLAVLLDRRDERLAMIRREQIGPYGWLVSWSHCRNGRWMARLSCPQWPATIERGGPTRREAIRRAESALRRLLIKAGATTDCASELRS